MLIGMDYKTGICLADYAIEGFVRECIEKNQDFVTSSQLMFNMARKVVKGIPLEERPEIEWKYFGETIHPNEKTLKIPNKCYNAHEPAFMKHLLNLLGENEGIKPLKGDLRGNYSITLTKEDGYVYGDDSLETFVRIHLERKIPLVVSAELAITYARSFLYTIKDISMRPTVEWTIYGRKVQYDNDLRLVYPNGRIEMDKLFFISEEVLYDLV